jgi:oxygen-dependent protoporphyrinogen oxidase
MKRVAIIGGGISGLAVLHYLKQRFGDSVEFKLFERESEVGGTIRSFKRNSCLFEWGPNGFLDNQPATLQLIKEMGADEELIEANPTARRRYIQVNDALLALPANPVDFICTPLLPFKDKCSLIAGIFKKDVPTDLSIYEYVSQRFSPAVATSLIDPFISGIYAGDIKRLHMASAFPKMKSKGLKKSRMRSFKGGMGQIIDVLEKRYHAYIKNDSEISSLPIDADVTVMATPAYAAAQILEDLNPVLSKLLFQIPYAPIAVAGFLFKQEAFKKMPDGFGYLIPSQANKDILGVLIESNVYEDRAGRGLVMMRVMLGGAHHPSIINDEQDRLLGKALKEIDKTYGLRAKPVETFVKLWPQAIPQYEINYPQLRQSIAEQCARTQGLFLCANYLDGISFNDCINNARLLAGKINI